jgi:hypothetical protein
VADRASRVKKLMKGSLSRGRKGNYSVPPKVEAQIETLFGTTTWGFREIMLVVVIARLLDDTYMPSKALYDCNPRALYEGPMLSVLRAEGIPARKSGPLNIAKAAQGLTKEWAAQRRPKRVAAEIVSLVKKIEQMNHGELENFSAALHARFLQEAKRVEALAVTAPPESDPQHLYEIACALIDDVPDAGNTPQHIVGHLMEAYHTELQTGIVVTGHLDRASVTSTTSKKPGDINEEQADGSVLCVYEVTVKEFGGQRVDESYDTVTQYSEGANSRIREVIVICRPEDLHPDAETRSETSAIYLGRVEHQDLTYHFLDIYEWIIAQLSRMPVDARLSFHQELSEYIADPNTSEAVKRRWADLAGSQA